MPVADWLDLDQGVSDDISGVDLGDLGPGDDTAEFGQPPRHQQQIERAADLAFHAHDE